MNWSRKKVAVTGATGFIGGALVDRLLDLGADIWAVDKIFAKPDMGVSDAARRLSRLAKTYKRHGAAESAILTQIDLGTERERFAAMLASNAIDVVFHLAALFGGREFVEIHQVECSRMLAVDHNVISAASEAGVGRVHYASSACVYPPDLQRPGPDNHPLKESEVVDSGHRGHWWRASDNLYGWAKLMGELQCRVFHEERGMKTSTCRYLTVYGPGEFDASHAIPALIERALDRADPFLIWGSGNQERGFTYIDDIVNGSIGAVEKIQDGTPINLGTDDRYSVDQVADRVLELVGYKPTVEHDLSKPEGPFSRALDVSRAKELLGWAPSVSLREGLKKTVEWHAAQRMEAVVGS